MSMLAKAAHAVGAHRVTTRPSGRRVRVLLDGQILAESERAVELHETGLPTRYYIPREDVRLELLDSSDKRTHCPFKGDASYFSAPGAPDAFWVYERPDTDEAQPIAGMLAPDPRKVTVVVE